MAKPVSLVRQLNLRWLDHLPPGWHGIYRDLIEKLADEHPDVLVDQAKQKFGVLRVYFHPHAEAAEAMYAKAQLASAETCEACGAAGRMMVDSSGWYRTLCNIHSRGFRPPTRRA